MNYKSPSINRIIKKVKRNFFDKPKLNPEMEQLKNDLIALENFENRINNQFESNIF